MKLLTCSEFLFEIQSERESNCYRFVPHLLSEEQKESHMNIYKGFQKKLERSRIPFEGNHR